MSKVIYPGNNLKVYSPDGLMASSATAAMSSPLFVSGDLQFEGCGLGKTIPRLYGSCVAYLSYGVQHDRHVQSNDDQLWRPALEPQESGPETSGTVRFRRALGDISNLVET